MSRDRLDDLDLADSFGTAREGLRGLSIVWSERTGEIVTVFHPHRGPAAVGDRRVGLDWRQRFLQTV
jgi:hypothetical protein